MRAAAIDNSTDTEDPVKQGADTLNWLAPNYRATPAEVLPRIKLICQLHGDLHAAMGTGLKTLGSRTADRTKTPSSRGL